MPNIGLLSNKVKVVGPSNAASDRYSYLDLKNAEPNFGVPVSDNGILASMSAGTRKYLYTSAGLAIDGLGNITVDEDTVAIDTSAFVNSASSTLAGVLADLDRNTRIGDLQGSVFGDDSTLLVDGVGNIITGDVVNSSVVTNELNTPLIDTQDSSPITVVPEVIFNSDITVENDINLRNNLEISNIQHTSADTATHATTAPKSITQFDGSQFSSGKLIVQVKDNVTSEVQVCQISVVHNTNTASTTEYSNLFTGLNPLATFSAEIRGAFIHIDATAASTNSTTYKVLKTLVKFI